MESEQRWLVDEIAADFVLLDRWEIPLTLQKDSPRDLETILVIIHEREENQDLLDVLTTFLFWFRKKLGSWLRLDTDVNCLPIPGCKETSLKERIKEIPSTTEHANSFDELFNEEGQVVFKTVYSLRNECLLELSNNTVHGLMHYGLKEKSKSQLLLTLSVYVKTRGLIGSFYMKLITPFRHLIVYPTLIKNATRNWESYRHSPS